MLPKITFSFSYLPNNCLDGKVKGKHFTNKVSKKEKDRFFAQVFASLKGYSNYTLVELGQQQKCYSVKEEKSLGRLSEVLQALNHSEEWVTKTFHNYPIYKFKVVSGNIRMFGYYNSHVFYILLFDPYHLIEPDDKFGAPDSLVCTWCLKNCDE
jgi:hypothetical protein